MGGVTIRDEPKKSDNLLLAAMESAPGGLLIVDADGMVSFCNAAMLRLWDLSGEPVPPDAASLLQLLDERLSDRGQFSVGDIRPDDAPTTLELINSRWLVGQSWVTTVGEGGSGRVWQFHELDENPRLSDDRLRDFAEVASDYFWESGPDGRFTFVSESYQAVTGIRRADVLGRTRKEVWQAFGQPDKEANRDHLAEADARVLGREPFSDVRVDWRRPDGVDLILSISGMPVFGRNGDFLGYRGVGVDVTQAARTEERLRDSEGRLRDLLDASPIGVSVVAKKSGERLYVNRAFADIMGAGSVDQLIGGIAADTWVDPADRGPMLQILKSGEDLVDYEHRRRRFDGSEFWVLMNSRAVEFAGTDAYMFWFIDITARRETERLVRESEQRLRQILDESPIAISMKSLEGGKRQFANQAYAEMFGAEQVAEIMKVPVEETWVDPEQLAEIRQVFDDGGELKDFEAQRRRLDGSEFPGLVNSHAIQFGGAPARVFWTMDLTERKRAEEAVRQSEERLRVILETSPIGFAVVANEDGRRMFVNRATMELFGAKDKEEFLAQPIVESWANPSDLDSLREQLKHGDVVNLQALRRRVDGRNFWALLNSQNLEYEGEPARVLWMTDISDRVEAEEALRGSEQKLREILETSPVGISVVSQRSGERLFANYRMAGMFGAVNAELVVATPMKESWLNEEDRQNTNLILAGSGGLVNHEVRRRRMDGTHFWCLLNSSEIEFEGEPAYVIWHNDITIMKVQQQVYQKAKEDADAANRAKSGFLSSMSHELRTPLNAILGFGQMLRLDEEMPLNERQDNSVEQILRGGQHLLDLIDQVLDLAKIEGGKLELDVEPVPVEEVLNECRDLVETTAGRRRISLRIELPAAKSELEVSADPTWLRQVILNLLSNAIKYNRDGGRITVTGTVIERDMLRISVTDTGIGIAREHWTQVFEPFTRLGAETTEIEGTGIGLTLSKQLIEKMGGRIGFTSEADMGSVFWITVPLARAIPSDLEVEGGAAHVEATDLENRAEGVVLYVEDNPANLQLMELIFEHLEGLRLITAPTAEIGLEMAETHLPDAVLMDIRLPGMDGFEALQRLRANAPTRHIPVIALSADAMPENVERGRAAGFAEYLTKPINVRLVVQALNAAMGQETAEEGLEDGG